MKNCSSLLILLLVIFKSLSSGFSLFVQQPWAPQGYIPSVFSHDSVNEFIGQFNGNGLSKRVIPKFKSDLENDYDSQHFLSDQKLADVNFMSPNFPDDGAHSSILYAPWGNAAPMFSYSSYLGNPLIRPLHSLWPASAPLRPRHVPGISRSLFPMPHIVQSSSRHFEDRRPVVNDDDDDAENDVNGSYDQDENENDIDDDDDDGDGGDGIENTEQRRDGENKTLEDSIRKQIDLNKAEIEREEAWIRHAYQLRPLISPYFQPNYLPSAELIPLAIGGVLQGPVVVPMSNMQLRGNISPTLDRSYLYSHGDLTVNTDGRYQRVHIPKGWEWKMNLPDDTQIRVT